ncbi:MAG: cytochrome c3 family protein [Hahellaceae bacterium]|nr:cytochrome c3 family protein [Hahellaceae bacterium]MCP5169257.1 cytochrome c3 family protein [Hahellaceae bacterium]
MSSDLEQLTQSARFWPTGLWLAVTTLLVGFFAWLLFGAEDKSWLLIGESSHGHYQIELSCESCHTSPFGGKEVLQKACEQCHAEALNEAHDSHPKKKFTDPRNADRLEALDARYCVACHQEHQNEYTDAMGVTLPGDFCVDCHKDIAKERPSHQGMAFDTCASAGCHNYHDNRALYEDFLVTHATETSFAGKQPRRNALERYLEKQTLHSTRTAPLGAADASAPADALQNAPTVEAWANSAHALSGINCGACHTNDSNPMAPDRADDTRHAGWQNTPDITGCRNCHENQWQGFTQGHHGMRLDARLAGNKNKPASPLQVADARLPMNPDAGHQSLTCNSCHDPHEPDLKKAATEACLGCHADKHSQNFNRSPHGQLWQQALVDTRDIESAVSCATCHMPRLLGEQGAIHVEHNQSSTLRPNEKMIRPVCMNCHSLSESIDALADPLLIERNFDRQPAGHILSIEMALKRAAPAK